MEGAGITINSSHFIQRKDNQCVSVCVHVCACAHVHVYLGGIIYLELCGQRVFSESSWNLLSSISAPTPNTFLLLALTPIPSMARMEIPCRDWSFLEGRNGGCKAQSLMGSWTIWDVQQDLMTISPSRPRQISSNEVISMKELSEGKKVVESNSSA